MYASNGGARIKWHLSPPNRRQSYFPLTSLIDLEDDQPSLSDGSCPPRWKSFGAPCAMTCEEAEAAWIREGRVNTMW